MSSCFGKDWELLLIDDKSTDNSLGIIKEAAARNGNIRYFSHALRRARPAVLKQDLIMPAAKS